MSQAFAALVRSTFAFLVDEFGFDILDEKEDDKRPFYWGSVMLGSSATVISVDVDRGVLGSPTIGRRMDVADFGSVASISLDRIYEFQQTSDPERSQLSSGDPEKMTRAFRESIEPKLVNLRNREFTADGFASMDLRIEHTLQVYSRLMKEHAEQYLQGDFSNWLELCEYVWYWLIASEFANDRRWGEELTLENVERRFSKLRKYLGHLRGEYE